MNIALSGKLLRFASLAALVLAPVGTTRAADEDIATVIARARAYLGTDAALDAVRSLRFHGTVTADDGSTHKIEIIMQRPMQQLMIETTDKVRAVTALDDYMMWRRMEPIEGEGSGRVQLMNAQAVRFARANVGQTLFYYRGLEALGGTAVVDGEEEIEGIPCVRAIFTHPGDIRYVRFFDKATGRLVVTRSEGGTETRETGETIVDGIRFPKELTTMVGDKTSRIVFEEIRVNETFDLARFQLPQPKLQLDFPAPGKSRTPATSETSNASPPAPAPASTPAP